jgi:hypothetical protein
MPTQCFLIEPIYGDPLPDPDTSKLWPPHRLIVGWTRPDTWEVHRHNRDFGAGAMFYAIWLPRNWTWENEDRPHLHLRCPNGTGRTSDWDIDSRASNCELPHDNVHRCWVIEGTPPLITVSKGRRGQSCRAGAGSIQLEHFHGMLRQGILTP